MTSRARGTRGLTCVPARLALQATPATASAAPTRAMAASTRSPPF